MFFLPFGDSHTYFWGNQTRFPGPSCEAMVQNIHWLGPAKAYGLTLPTKNNTKENYLRIKPFLEQSDQIPIACFGEIDVRVNCAKEFIFHGGTEHISKLVDAYLSELSTIKNSDILLWGPPPSAPDDGLFATEYPAYGDNQTRNYVTHCFNEEIIKKIRNYSNLRFLTIFYDLINADLTTKPKVLADGCHLSVAYHDQAINFAKQMLEQDHKIMLNGIGYQSVRKHRRVFRSITNWGKTPYVNYYKKPAGELLHYFSHTPYFDSTEEITCAGLEVL
ncbi:hypothetical protein MCEMSE6_01817 [Oxalobacteraceae bacterium]